MVDALEVPELSLADLADIDVSDVEEMRFETLPQGVYEFEVTAADMEEKLNKDEERRFLAAFEYKILAVKSVLEAGVDKEALVGKIHKEALFINPGAEPKAVQEAIGRIRAHITDMGCDSAGKLGDIVRNTKGHIFTSRLVHQKDKNDKTVVYAKLKLEAKKH